MKKTTKALFIILLICTAIILASCGLLGGDKSGGIGKKVALTESMIIRNPTQGSGVPVYTGKPVTYPESDFGFEVKGNYPSYSDFTYTYENNVNAGDKTARLTITAKNSNPYCTGSVTLYFSIAQGSAEAKGKDELTAFLNNANYNYVTLDTNVDIEETETLTIPAGATLRLAGNAVLTIKGSLEVQGQLTVDGSKYYQGGTRSGMLKNAGSINNSGSVVVTSHGLFINHGVFLSEGTVKNEGLVYADGTAVPGLVNEKTGRQFVRSEITSEDISIPAADEGGIEYSQKDGVARPYVTLPYNAGFNVVYQNNDRVGQATVIVTPTETDSYYYGSASRTFTILPGVATVKDYAELTAASATGNFNRFEITGEIIVPAGDKLLIQPQETLNFAGNKLTVHGACENNGEIKSYRTNHNSYTNETTFSESTLNITINEGGSFGGTGKLSAGKVSVTAKGDFSIQSPESTTFDSFNQSKGTLCIGSDITVPTLTIGLNAALSVLSGGTINCSSLAVNGGLVCSGTINVARQCNLYFNVERSLENGGRLCLGTADAPAETYAETYIEYLNMSNDGEILNYGDFVCDHVTTYLFSSQTHFINNGHIWTYEEFGNITENVTVKKYLSDSIVALEYTEVEYDGSEKTPSFTVEGIAPENLNKNYVVKYYKPDNTAISSVKDVGEYVVSVSVPANNKKYAYGGSVTLPYNIKKGTCHLTSSDAFNSSLANANYEKVLMEADIDLGYTYSLGTYEIPEGAILDTNGYSLTVTKANFYVSGELILSAPTGERAYSLLLLQTSNLHNRNTIRNSGVLCFDSPSESYSTDGYANATFINDGIVYGGSGESNYSFIQSNVTSGEGTVYVRTPLPKTELDLEYTETNYTGERHTPVVSYTGSALAAGAFDAFSKVYDNNKNAGAATVTVKPDLLNETYYGSVTMGFTINKAVKVVTGSLKTSDFANKNYYEVRLGNSIILSEDVVVPRDMAFNFSVYELYYSSGRLLVEEGAVLRAEANNLTTFLQNINNVHEMKLIDNITEKISVTFQPINTDSHKIYLWYNQQYANTLQLKSLLIDLNGYSMTGGFDIEGNTKNYSNPYFTVTIDNSRYNETESGIGSVTNTDYGFNPKLGNSIVININNITVAGVKMDGNHVQLNANNCHIETAGEYAVYCNDMNSETTFTDCTFSATGNNGKIIYLNRGTHHLNNCTYNASALDANMIYYRTGTGGGTHEPQVYLNGVKLN